MKENKVYLVIWAKKVGLLDKPSYGTFQKCAFSTQEKAFAFYSKLKTNDKVMEAYTLDEEKAEG